MLRGVAEVPMIRWSHWIHSSRTSPLKQIEPKLAALTPHVIQPGAADGQASCNIFRTHAPSSRAGHSSEARPCSTPRTVPRPNTLQGNYTMHSLRLVGERPEQIPNRQKLPNDSNSGTICKIALY